MFPYGFEGLSLHVCHRVMADAYRPYLLQCRNLFSKEDYCFASQAVPGIIQSLATTLDNVLLLFVNEDLKQYRSTHKINPQKMSSEASSEALDVYFQRLNSEGLVKHFLGKADLNFSRETEIEHLLPSLLPPFLPPGADVKLINHPATVIDVIAVQFIINMELMLRRVSEDRPLILDAICVLNSVPIPPQLHNLKLTAAKLLESDAHKFGKQVMKLEFRYPSVPPIHGELIYKPSSIAIETAIAGNVSLLRRIDPSYPLTESCFELINDMLSGEVKLPTYLMMPRGQNDTPANEVNAYGYKQVLKCEPYPDLDLTKVVTEYLGQIQPANRDLKVEELQAIQNPLGYHVLEIIKKSVTTSPVEKIEQYDCVTTKLSDLEFFSKQCGMLFAAFYVLKIGDMHAENVLATCVANGKQIMPIDIENAFNPIINPENIGAIGSLQPDVGGFSRRSFAPINFSVLLGIEGVLGGKALMPCRNLLYLLTKREDRVELNSVVPILEGFREGAALTLKCIITNKDRLIHWLGHPYVQSCLVRVLPFNTSSLQAFRSGAFLYPNVTMEIDSRPDQWLDDFVVNAARKELSTTVALTPSFYAASKPYPFHEVLSYSVPIYYMRANGIQLLNGRGEPVSLDEQDQKHLEEEIEKGNGKRADGAFVDWRQVLLTPNGQTRYYTISPVETVVRSLVVLNDEVASNVIEFIERQVKTQKIMLKKEEVRDAYFPEETVAGAAVFEVRSRGVEPH